MVASIYGYGIVAMAALGYGGPQSAGTGNTKAGKRGHGKSGSGSWGP